jgi:hypothetical protein
VGTARKAPASIGGLFAPVWRLLAA